MLEVIQLWKWTEEGHDLNLVECFRLNRDFAFSSCLYSLMYGCKTKFKFEKMTLYHPCQSCDVMFSFL